MLFSLATFLLQYPSLKVLTSLHLKLIFSLAVLLFLDYVDPFSFGFMILIHLVARIASDEYHLSFGYAFLVLLLLAQDYFFWQVHAVKIH
jgi:uncharacterized membrane protein YqjE